MACFIVPAVEAVVTTALTKHIEKNEKEETKVETGIPFSRKLKWLNNMLWGGSASVSYTHLDVYKRQVQQYNYTNGGIV